jgi:Leucine rich repeat/WG containing repeat
MMKWHWIWIACCLGQGVWAQNPCATFDCVIGEVNRLLNAPKKDYELILNKLDASEGYDVAAAPQNKAILKNLRQRTFKAIEGERLKALTAEAEAKKQARRAEIALNQADSARNIAENEKKRAEIARSQADSARDIAEQEKQKTEKLIDIATQMKSEINGSYLKIKQAYDVIALAKYEAEKARVQSDSARKKLQIVLDRIYFYDGKFGLSYDSNLRKYGFIDKDLNIKIEFKYDAADNFDANGFAKVTLPSNLISSNPKISTFYYALIDTTGREYKVINDISQLNSKVLALDLRNKYLKEIPKEVFQNKQLKIMFLNKEEIVAHDRENLIEKLPNEIGELVNLTVLNLSGNELIQIPNDITKLAHLKTLDLRKNNLSDLPSGITNLTELTYLDLSNNAIPYSKQMEIKAKMPDCQVITDENFAQPFYHSIQIELNHSKKYRLLGILIDSIKKSSDSSLKANKILLSAVYNSRAWSGFFCGLFEEAEQAIRDDMNLGHNINLSIDLLFALLLQGKMDEAIAECQKLKKQTNLNLKFQFYVQVFKKADILTAQHKRDIKTIRKLLEQ